MSTLIKVRKDSLGRGWLRVLPHTVMAIRVSTAPTACRLIAPSLTCVTPSIPSEQATRTTLPTFSFPHLMFHSRSSSSKPWTPCPSNLSVPRSFFAELYPQEFSQAAGTLAQQPPILPRIQILGELRLVDHRTLENRTSTQSDSPRRRPDGTPDFSAAGLRCMATPQPTTRLLAQPLISNSTVNRFRFLVWLVLRPAPDRSGHSARRPDDQCSGLAPCPLATSGIRTMVTPTWMA